LEDSDAAKQRSRGLCRDKAEAVVVSAKKIKSTKDWQFSMRHMA